MTAILYLITATATLLLARGIRRFSFHTALILLLLPVLMTVRALAGGAVYGPLDLAYTSEPLASISAAAGDPSVSNPAISDVYTEFFPWNEALRRSVQAGQPPLWNPYELCGTPLAGAAQAAPYHPVTLLGLLLPISAYFGFAAAMLYLAAALCAFLLALELTESEWAALMAAAGWMASTHIVFFAGTAMAHAVSLAPLLFLAARRVVRRPSRGAFVLLTGTLTLLILSGHPESMLHLVAVGVLYGAYQLWRSRPASVSRAMLTALAAGASSLLLCAFFLLPHIEAILQSEEYVHRELGYEQESSTVPQMLHRLRASFFPFLEGAEGIEAIDHAPEVSHGWLATAYAGTILLMAALYGLLRSGHEERWFFGLLLLLGLAAGIGAPGLTELLDTLPLFDIAVNDRLILFAAMATAVLAAMGVRHYLERPDALFPVMLLGGAVMIAAAAWLGRSAVSPDYLRMAAGRALIPLLLAAAALRVLDRRWAAQSLLLLLLVQRAGETAALQPALPARGFYPPFPGLEIMQSAEPFRIVGVETMLPPALSTHYGLEDVRGFQAVTFKRYDDTYPLWCKRQPVWSNRVDDLRSPMLSMMNVRFAITPPLLPLPAAWQRRASFPGYAIVENTHVLPRAFLPRSIQEVAGPEESLRALAAIHDFRQTGLVETGVSSPPVENGAGTLSSITAGNRRLTLRASMSGPGWVMVTNAAWKGWQARLDGREARIYIGNHAFLAVPLTAGDHELELRYLPDSVRLGSVVSVLSLLTLLTLLQSQLRHHLFHVVPDFLLR